MAGLHGLLLRCVRLLCLCCVAAGRTLSFLSDLKSAVELWAGSCSVCVSGEFAHDVALAVGRAARLFVSLTARTVQKGPLAEVQG